jgi:MOSC domain-containing protein YiiM
MEPLQVTELFIKRRHDAPLLPAATITCSPRGIAKSVPCAPFRQALIASRSVAAELALNPGDLRENIVVNCDDLYDLPSGTVVKVGQALLRLTFHCEPCRKMLKLIEFDRIVHRRGVFGMFLNDAPIALGDEFAVTQQRFEEIPYAINERIRWFLRKHDRRGAALDLVHKLGLPASSGRIMPRLLSKLLDATPTVEAVAGEAREMGRTGPRA